MNHKNRIFTLLTLFILAMFVFVPTASAYDGRSGETVTISADETVNDDLYLGGTTVVVDGTVNGNLIVAGQDVTINGKVTGSIFAAGRSVTINGEVGKSVITAGAVVTFGPNAQVTDDVVSAGGGIETKAGSKINGSLLMAGGQGLIDSEIGKDLVASAGSLRIESTIGRDAKLAVGSADSDFNPQYYGPEMPAMPSVPGGLTFGPDAKVAGSLEYTSDKAVAIDSSVSADVNHILPPQDQQIATEVAQQNTTSNAVFDAIRRLIALLLMGGLLAWLAPRWITSPAEVLKFRPLPSFGLGIVGLAASVPVALTALGAVILAAVIFGLLSLGALSGLIVMAGLPTIALALVAFGAVFSYLCQAIVGYLLGQWVISRTRSELNSSLFAPVLVGLLILGLLFAIPVAGGILEFITAFTALGAIILLVTQRKSPSAAPAVPVETAPVIAG